MDWRAGKAVLTALSDGYFEMPVETFLMNVQIQDPGLFNSGR
jgi:hypothetical protein